MIVLYSLSALLVVLLCVTFVMFRIVFHSPNRRQNDDFEIPHSDQTDPLRDRIESMIRAANAMPYERIGIRSHDGLRLCGRWYHQRDGAPVAILFHGYRGTPSRDFSGGMQMYLDAGFNLLLIEQRAHCGSEGHVITFGVKERLDCLAWIDCVRARCGEQVPILLAGISMGASTVLLASGMRLPKNVVGIVADSPFTTPKEIMRKVAKDLKLPPRIIYAFLWLGARIFGGFRPADADTVEAVRHSPVPILIIHGEDDRFVPCEMGRRIAAVGPAAELHTFPHAGHGLSFLIDRARYERITAAFLARLPLKDSDL